jgi:RNA polymerase sigma factor (sigma-70 family)
MTRSKRSTPKKRRPLSEPQRELCAKYIPFALSYCIPECRQWPREADEIRSTVMLALVSAARTWREGRGTKFSTYLRSMLDWRLMDFFRRLKQRNLIEGASNLPRFVPLCPGFESACLARPFDPSVDLERGEQTDLLTRWKGLLPEDEAHVIDGIYGRNLTLIEVARELGVSRQRASVLHRRALERGRKREGRGAILRGLA